MNDDAVPQILVGISFEDPFRAREYLSAISRLASRGELQLVDAVIVAKSAGGRTMVEETTDPQPVRAAASGAVWAGLFGLMLGGPVGWLAGAAVGAGVGAVTAKVVDHGIPDEWVDWFKQAIEHDTTTVAILATDLSLEALVTEASRFVGATLLYANLDPAAVERLTAALHGAPAEPAVAAGDS
jgi:uncharacterized membrane protein